MPMTHSHHKYKRFKSRILITYDLRKTFNKCHKITIFWSCLTIRLYHKCKTLNSPWTLISYDLIKTFNKCYIKLCFEPAANSYILLYYKYKTFKSRRTLLSYDPVKTCNERHVNIKYFIPVAYLQYWNRLLK